MEMRVARVRKKEKIEAVTNTEAYSIQGMIKILFCLLIIFVIFYLITNFIIKNKEQAKEDAVSVIDSSRITLNQLLNRSEEEYFVIATKASLYKNSYIDVNYITLYNEHINKYKQKEGSYSFYYVDLDNALNKNNLGDNLNITDDLSKLKLNDEVLFKIKNGSIEKTYVGRDEILDKLARL
jgi:hypothetical protein